MNHNGEDESQIVLIHEKFFINFDPKAKLNPFITAWTISAECIILGTFTGSLYVYSIQDTSKFSLLQFTEMEPITCLVVTDQENNNILMGNEQGQLNVVSFKFENNKVHDNELDTLGDFGSKIIEIHAHKNQSLFVVTLQKVFLVEYTKKENRIVKIASKKVFYETEQIITQIDLVDTQVLVTTDKMYFLISIFGSQVVQVGSKNDGSRGSTFFQVEQRINVYAARKGGYLWNARITDGVVDSSVQYTKNGAKIKFGKLKTFNKFIVSFEENRINKAKVLENNKEEGKKIEKKTLYVIDPINTKDGGVILEERIENQNNSVLMYIPPLYTKNSARRQRVEYFMVLIQQENGLSIKMCELKSAKVAFRQYMHENKMEEAQKLCLKYECLWQYSIIQELFEKMSYDDKNLLEDPRFDALLTKLEGEDILDLKVIQNDEFNDAEVINNRDPKNLMPTDYASIPVRYNPKDSYNEIDDEEFDFDVQQLYTEQLKMIKDGNHILRKYWNLMDSFMEAKGISCLYHQPQIKSLETLRIHSFVPCKLGDAYKSIEKLLREIWRFDSLYLFQRMWDLALPTVYTQPCINIIQCHCTRYCSEHNSIIKSQKLALDAQKLVLQKVFNQRLDFLVTKFTHFKFLNTYERGLYAKYQVFLNELRIK